MNNEPVAWINRNIDIENGKPQLAWHKDNCAEICKPLYTHPHSEESVKAKTLTDEDIHKIAQKHFHAGLGISPLDFAKAILKKASEK
jgi:hypothetical protein